jgi:DinB superfamily
MLALELLARIISEASARLGAITGDHAKVRSSADAWSRKEELGHLIDSAWNNYVRIIRAQLEDSPALPEYAQNGWVALQGYQERDWNEVVGLWAAVNRHLLHAARAIPAASLLRTCTVGPSEPLTIQFLLDDYLDHMLHHLEHIGIAVDDFRPAKAAGR